MECTFSCNWFHSYRAECVASPCLAEGNSCETAGAPSGSACAAWCCVYEPVRGLIFLPVAIAVIFLMCVIGRCACRWAIVRRRKQRAARIKLEEEEFDDDDEEDEAYNVRDASVGSEKEHHEPIASNPTQYSSQRVAAPTMQRLVFPLDRSVSPPTAVKDVSSLSPPPHPPLSPEPSFNVDFDDYHDDAGSSDKGGRKPWYA
jgi:hypothetical protein